LAKGKPVSQQITIVDRGRGPQLSTNRITVQDLVPYFQRRCTHEQIREVMPVLTAEEIRLVEQYINDHLEAVMDQDRRIRNRAANRTNPPEVEEILRRGGAKMAALREQFGREKQHGQERNGDRPAG
jgi:uncharacterized protein (DUF433 family)